MRLYGRGYYGSGPYGRGYPPGSVNVPTQVWVWDRNGTLKAMYQVGSSPISVIEFTHGERGAGSFSITSASELGIVETDRIKIRVFNSIGYFYTGVVRSVPELGSTKKGFEYSGYGYNDYFQRVNAGTLNYANKTISYIVLDVFNNLLAPPVTPIIYQADKFDPPDITVVSLVANYCQVNEVFDALIKIANSTGTEYNYGVDKDGVFYFLPRSEAVIDILQVGKRGRHGIRAYEPESANEARTKIILLDKDGVYIDTYSSTEDNDVWEEKVTAPDIDAADAALWAAGILAQKERTTKSASIEWDIERDSPLPVVADGNLRIISAKPPYGQVTLTGVPFGGGTFGGGYFGGGPGLEWAVIDDTLAIREVKYHIDGRKAFRSIELGSLPIRLEDTIVDVDKRLTELTVSLGV